MHFSEEYMFYVTWTYLTSCWGFLHYYALSVCKFHVEKKQSPQIIKRPKARMIIKRNLNVQKNEDMLFLQDNTVGNTYWILCRCDLRYEHWCTVSKLGVVIDLTCPLGKTLTWFQIQRYLAKKMSSRVEVSSNIYPLVWFVIIMWQQNPFYVIYYVIVPESKHLIWQNTYFFKPLLSIIDSVVKKLLRGGMCWEIYS